jgi:hypothetical protein
MSRRNGDRVLRASGTIATRRQNDNAALRRTGAETVSGTKTVDGSPVVVAPTAGAMRLRIDMSMRPLRRYARRTIRSQG